MATQTNFFCQSESIGYELSIGQILYMVSLQVFFDQDYGLRVSVPVTVEVILFFHILAQPEDFVEML